VFDNINHYIAEKLFVYVGHDMPTNSYYSGEIGHARVVTGPGAFKPGNKFDDDDNDPHGFSIGFNKLVQGQEDKKPKPEDKVYTSAHDEKKPVVDNDKESKDDLEEYGYGFWMRFLHTYPKRMM